MELSERQIARLRALDERQLRTLLTQAATEMGLGTARARLLSHYSGKLHARLQSLSDDEIRRFLQVLSDEQAKGLLAKLNTMG